MNISYSYKKLAFQEYGGIYASSIVASTGHLFHMLVKLTQLLSITRNVLGWFSKKSDPWVHVPSALCLPSKNSVEAGVHSQMFGLLLLLRVYHIPSVTSSATSYSMITNQQHCRQPHCCHLFTIAALNIKTVCNTYFSHRQIRQAIGTHHSFKSAFYLSS